MQNSQRPVITFNPGTNGHLWPLFSLYLGSISFLFVPKRFQRRVHNTPISWPLECRWNLLHCRYHRLSLLRWSERLPRHLLFDAPVGKITHSPSPIAQEGEHVTCPSFLNDLRSRAWQHRPQRHSCFTKKFTLVDYRDICLWRGAVGTKLVRRLPVCELTICPFSNVTALPLGVVIISELPTCCIGNCVDP
jgi:hypothetical protein